MSTVLTPPEQSTRTTTGAWFTQPPRTEGNALLPDWYREIRDRAWDRFGETPAPVRTNQQWRFADLKHTRFEGLATADCVDETTAAGLVSLAIAERPLAFAAHFVFANNRLIHAETPGLPEGVRCQPIAEALAEDAEGLREQLLNHQDFIGGDKFAALHASASLSGLFIDFAKGAVADAPVVVHHFVGGAGATIFPQTLILAADHAEVSVLEIFESINEDEPTLVVGRVDLEATRGAKIQHVTAQALSDRGGKLVQLQHTRAGRDAGIKVGFLNLGGEWVRNESVNRMVESGADVQIFSANLANGVQEFDQRTLQSHEAQHTTSDLFFKNALYDRSRTIFSGLIQVQPGAHHTDSFQTCRNLLGSDEAEANSMPGLEIDADQVKCSHGSTSGTISDEEIFYLRARGIPAEEARKMISLGFLNEAIERLGGQSVKELLCERIERKFASLG